jgi:putative NADH-flavin reductase
MRIFVTGATGALGRHLVPGLVAAGHEVTATTRTPGKVAQLREAGAEPVVLDGLDREAVIAAVLAAAPEVIVHQMTALAGMRSLRKPDKAFAATNELRTWGTDNLLAAAERAGTRRVIAQGYAGAGPDKPSGGALKTEEDPLDWRPIRSAVQGPAAITYVDKTVPLEGKDLGWVPRYASWREGFRAWVSGSDGRGRVPAAAALHRYGMTGSVGDAEDVVQDAFLGLTRARQAGTTITDPKAYLTTVVSRLGINSLRSARVRRETYVGDWLPKPVVVPAGGAPKIPPACPPSGDARPRRRFVASLPGPAPPRPAPVVTGPGHGGLPRR